MFLRIDFPTGQYYAAQLHNPAYPEWPPHPSRVYSALVASAYRSPDGMTEGKRECLQWLEALCPPSIYAPEASLIESPVTYVPPGDMRRLKKNKVEHGVYRLRQPRHFPRASILDEPSVYMGWDSDPTSELYASLKKIAFNVTHVGTSHSMVVMSAHRGKMPKQPTLLPDIAGSHFLRVHTKGRLNELDGVYRHQTGVRRPPAACENLAAYKAASKSLDTKLEAAFEFISLRITGTMHGADTAACIGKAFRRAVMSVLGDEVPAAVHGHNEGIHVGWLPLPDVDHQYASGRIVGIAVAIPKEMDHEHRRLLLSGISRINELYLPDGRTAKLSPTLPGEKVAIALKEKTWTKSSTVWSTVTPVVLDRPPKRLIEKRLMLAMSQSLTLAGYPEPAEIKVSAFSKFKGAPPAFTVPAAKPRYHATAFFDEPITGPVVAGRLRYFGIGFFRPITSSDSGDQK